MDRKSYLIASAGLILVLTILALRYEPVSASPKPMTTTDTRRTFYLTPLSYTGSQALTACAVGFHMASIWEIEDTTVLRYNTALGRTFGDSTFGGPPSDNETLATATAVRGWLRVGSGAPSCSVWTDNSHSHLGTYGYRALAGGNCANGPCQPAWAVEQNLPCDGIFDTSGGPLDIQPGVWCVQD